MEDNWNTSQIKGLSRGDIAWEPDFTATRDRDNVWSGSESFKCHLMEVPQFIPNNGAACTFPNFGFLKVSGVKVENDEGEIVRVTVEYGGTEEDDNNPASDEDPGMGLYQTELTISTNEEPLATHCKYWFGNGKLDETEQQVIRNILSGKFVPISDDPADAYKFKDVNNHEKTKYIEVTSEFGKELVDFINQGIESYLQPKQNWKASYRSKKPANAHWLNQVGLISTPLGDPPAVSNNRNWLFVGYTQTQDGEIYNITMDWQLSGIGGWKPELYDKTQFDL